MRVPLCMRVEVLHTVVVAVDTVDVEADIVVAATVSVGALADGQVAIVAAYRMVLHAEILAVRPDHLVDSLVVEAGDHFLVLAIPTHRNPVQVD